MAASSQMSVTQMEHDIRTLKHSPLVQHHEFVSMLRSVDKHVHRQSGEVVAGTGRAGRTQREENLHAFYSILLRMLVEVTHNPDVKRQRTDLRKVFDWYGSNKVLFIGKTPDTGTYRPVASNAQKASSRNPTMHARPSSTTWPGAAGDAPHSSSSRQVPSRVNTWATVGGGEPRSRSSTDGCVQENLLGKLMVKQLNRYRGGVVPVQTILKPAAPMQSMTRAVSEPSSGTDRRSISSVSSPAMAANAIAASTTTADEDTNGNGEDCHDSPSVSVSPHQYPASQSHTSDTPRPASGTGNDEIILDSYSNIRLSTDDLPIALDASVPRAAARYSRYAQDAHWQQQQQQQPHDLLHHHGDTYSGHVLHPTTLPDSGLRNTNVLTAGRALELVDDAVHMLARDERNHRSSRRFYSELSKASAARAAERRDAGIGEQRSDSSAWDVPVTAQSIGRQDANSSALDAGRAKSLSPAASRKSPQSRPGSRGNAQRNGTKSPVFGLSTLSSTELTTVKLELPSAVSPPKSASTAARSTVTRKPYQQRLLLQRNRPGSATARLAYPTISVSHVKPDAESGKSKRRLPRPPPRVEDINSLMTVNQLVKGRTGRGYANVTREHTSATDQLPQAASASQCRILYPGIITGDSDTTGNTVPKYIELAESKALVDRLGDNVPSPPATSQVDLSAGQSSDVVSKQVSFVHAHESAVLSYLNNEEGPSAPPASAAALARGSLLACDTSEVHPVAVVAETDVMPTAEGCDAASSEAMHQSEGDVDASVSGIPRVMISNPSIDIPSSSLNVDLVLPPAIVNKEGKDNDKDTGQSSMVDTAQPCLKPTLRRGTLKSRSCSSLPKGGKPSAGNAAGRATGDNASSLQRKVGKQGAARHPQSMTAGTGGELRPKEKRTLLSAGSRLASHSTSSIPAPISSESSSRSSSGPRRSPSPRRRMTKSATQEEVARQERAARVVQTNLRKYLQQKKRMAGRLATHSIRTQQQSWTEEELQQHRERDAQRRDKAEEERRQRLHNIAVHNKFKQNLTKAEAHSDIAAIFKPKLPTAKEKRAAATYLQKIARGFLQRRAMQKCYLLTATPGIPGLAKSIRQCKNLFDFLRAEFNAQDSTGTAAASLTYRELMQYLNDRIAFEKAFNVSLADSGESVVQVRRMKCVFKMCGKEPSWKEIRKSVRCVLALRDEQLNSATVTRETASADIARNRTVPDADQAQDISGACGNSTSAQDTKSPAEDDVTDDITNSNPDYILADEEVLGESTDHSHSTLISSSSTSASSQVDDVRLDKEPLTLGEFVMVAFHIYLPTGSGIPQTHSRQSTWMNPIVDGKDSGAVHASPMLDGTNLQACLDLVAQSRQERSRPSSG